MGHRLRMQFQAAAVQQTIICLASSWATVVSALRPLRPVPSPPISLFPIRPTSSTTVAARPARSSPIRGTTQSYTTAPAISSGVASTRLLWCGSQTPTGTAAAEHVGRYVQTIRENIGLDSSGREPLPQPNLWAACLEYRDTTGQPSSMAAASLTCTKWIGLAMVLTTAISVRSSHWWSDSTTPPARRSRSAR